MASSRKRRPKADPLDAELQAAVRAAVVAALSAAPATPAWPDADAVVRRRPRGGPLVLALSGGRDSVVLLELACRLRAARAPFFSDLLAVHVNHGLQPAAVRFAEHCSAICAARGVSLVTETVTVERRGRGLEAAAREARYRALADVARRHRARLVLTAHHRDDRLETFLIQWMRGAGPDGLAACAPRRAFDGDLLLARPLLDVSRAQIDAYVQAQGLSHVEDPSNASTDPLRNALRLQVLPTLHALRPGFARAAARAIDLQNEAAELLAVVARADLGHCAEEAELGLPGGSPMLRLDRVAGLPAARQALLLRRWLADAGLEAPPRARLLELLNQALTARSDARLVARLGALELRRHRGRLLLRAPTVSNPLADALLWQGESAIAVPGWRGALHFEPTAGQGFASDWLRAQPLQLRPRTGGERFKPHAARPSRTLKRAFQEAGIAEFERGALPLVWRGDELVFVAGLGPDVRLIDTPAAGEQCIRLLWRADAHLLAG